MKLLVVLSALVACVLGKPGLISPLALPYAHGLYAGHAISYAGHPISYAGHPISYAAPAYVSAPIAAPLAAPIVAPAPAVAVAAPVTKTQYHAQDELGNAAFGHSEPGQVHTSVQDGLGNRVGSYSYFNPTDGKVHRTDYVADALGFRVAANDLPIADLKAPEPVTDTPEVVAAREARLSGADLPKADLPAPEPVTDTPEVIAARQAHLSEHRAKRSVLVQTSAATAPLTTHLVAAPLAHPIAYSAHHPIAYSAIAAHHPVAYSAIPAGIPATLTTIVNNPGHAVSYRVD